MFKTHLHSIGIGMRMPFHIYIYMYSEWAAAVLDRTENIIRNGERKQDEKKTKLRRCTFKNENCKSFGRILMLSFIYFFFFISPIRFFSSRYVVHTNIFSSFVRLFSTSLLNMCHKKARNIREELPTCRFIKYLLCVCFWNISLLVFFFSCFLQWKACFNFIEHNLFSEKTIETALFFCIKCPWNWCEMPFKKPACAKPKPFQFNGFYNVWFWNRCEPFDLHFKLSWAEINTMRIGI